MTTGSVPNQNGPRRRIYSDLPSFYPTVLGGAGIYLSELSAPVLGRLAETLRADALKAERVFKSDRSRVAAGHAKALGVLLECIQYELRRRDDLTERAEATPGEDGE